MTTLIPDSNKRLLIAAMLMGTFLLEFKYAVVMVDVSLLLRVLEK